MGQRCHVCEKAHTDRCPSCTSDGDCASKKYPKSRTCLADCGAHRSRAFGKKNVAELSGKTCAKCDKWCCCSWDEAFWNSSVKVQARGGEYVDPVSCVGMGFTCGFTGCRPNPNGVGSWKVDVSTRRNKKARQEAFIKHLREHHRPEGVTVDTTGGVIAAVSVVTTVAVVAPVPIQNNPHARGVEIMRRLHEITKRKRELREQRAVADEHLKACRANEDQNLDKAALICTEALFRINESVQ